MDWAKDIELKGLAFLFVLIVVMAFLSGCAPANTQPTEATLEANVNVDPMQVKLSIESVSAGGLLVSWPDHEGVEVFRLYRLEFHSAKRQLVKETSRREILDVIGCSQLQYYKLFGVRAGQLVELSPWVEGRTLDCGVR